MSKRAERRHHYQRLKNKVKFYYGGQYKDNKYISWNDKEAGRIVETRPACSCHMCRNPRHSHFDGGCTIQEKKKFQESINDLISEYLEEKHEI